MSNAGEFWRAVDERSRKNALDPVILGQITALTPLTVQFQGIELSSANGDNIYINNLLLDENINLDLGSMNSPQNLASVAPKPWIADKSPNDSYTAEISGTQKQFLTDLYNWVKSVHDRFILHIGDYAAIQRLGGNTYIILEKVQKL